MDKATRGLLVGMVLGDGSLSVRQRQRLGSPYISSEMRVLHSLSQLDYCKHKCKLVAKALKRNPGVHIIKNGPGGKYKAARFTVSHPYFQLLKRWMYPGGIKTYTMRVLKMLTPEGIAIWYMDDGSARVNINKEGYVSSVATDIATMCSEAEAHTVAEYFLHEHGVKFKVRRKKSSADHVAYYMQASTEGSRDFANLVRGFIIPSMLYKLRHVADLDSHECRAPLFKCQCGANVYDKRWGGLCPSCYGRRYYAKQKR